MIKRPAHKSLTKCCLHRCRAACSNSETVTHMCCYFRACTCSLTWQNLRPSIIAWISVAREVQSRMRLIKFAGSLVEVQCKAFVCSSHQVAGLQLLLCAHPCGNPAPAGVPWGTLFTHSTVWKSVRLQIRCSETNVITLISACRFLPSISSHPEPMCSAGGREGLSWLIPLCLSRVLVRFECLSNHLCSGKCVLSIKSLAATHLIQVLPLLSFYISGIFVLPYIVKIDSKLVSFPFFFF